MAQTVRWTESRFLPVVLAPTEIQQRGEQLADAVRRRDELDAAHYAERERMRDGMKRAEAEVAKFAKIVNERAETRAVDVECVLNVALRMVEERRTDTDELLQTRGAEPRDALRQQGTLPLEDPTPKPEDETHE